MTLEGTLGVLVTTGRVLGFGFGLAFVVPFVVFAFEGPTDGRGDGGGDASELVVGFRVIRFGAGRGRGFGCGCGCGWACWIAGMGSGSGEEDGMERMECEVGILRGRRGSVRMGAMVVVRRRDESGGSWG